jgi:hypothetical protein
MSWFIVDCESDGPYPPDFSMVCFGVVKVTANLVHTPRFYSGLIKPISTTFDPEALAISGFTREQHEAGEDPKEAMLKLEEFLSKNSSGRPVFVSDNPAYDFQWINFYTHKFTGKNPFGWSGRRIGDIYCGLEKNVFAQWKYLRETKHTHNPVDDAMGNAEALLKMSSRGIKIPLK